MNEKMKNTNDINANEAEACKCNCEYGCGHTCECGGSCHKDQTSNESADFSGKFEFNLSNGTTYYVDPKDIEWEELRAHADDIKENAVMVRQMMINLMIEPNNEELINTIYDSLSTFLKGLNIELDYSKLSEISPDFSKREVCIIAVYDVTNIIETFLKHIEVDNVVADLMTSLTADGFDGNPFTSEEFEKHIEEMDKMVNLVEDLMKNNESIPTPEEFEKQMKEVEEKYHADPEACHGEMDELMMNLLEKLGYGAAVKIFDDSAKWYA